ncbi:hypothetical protein C9F11_01555 [Streptomyces sp. YIM 121038]|nr:hypothetical protein C9F11_01555 [Streptomyces sp. YIM 121038]
MAASAHHSVSCLHQPANRSADVGCCPAARRTASSARPGRAPRHGVVHGDAYGDTDALLTVGRTATSRQRCPNRPVAA